ncbi:hypothetical protein HPB48_017694 [Haemaphysalis longicornis]|uniref:Uncharacterized protein n=1 Tax=Haemaphysalis longicornis TaxID=44386 RepID=A0A9J6GLB6_HAELO|nr:hypothetical protein HPB48_017694 [Haemaphysalis longicornis]
MPTTTSPKLLAILCRCCRCHKCAVTSVLPLCLLAVLCSLFLHLSKLFNLCRCPSARYGERNVSGLQDVTKALAEKQPNSSKEVVKVLGDLLAKLDVFSSDVKNAVAKVTTSNAEIRTELGDIHQSMKFMNDCFENFKKDVDGFRREIAEVKIRNAECCKQNQELRKELAVARKELIELKQYSRNMNVEIQGIPVAPNEDLEKAVEDIAKCLEVEVSKDDIDVAHRVPTKKKGSVPCNSQISNKTCTRQFARSR